MNLHLSMRVYLIPVAIVLVVLLVNAAPAYAETLETQRCAANVCYIEITENGFSPQELVIKSGSIVVWKNVDNHIHMIKSGDPENHTGLFDSDLLSRNEAHGFAFMEEHLGSHEYFDLASSHAGRIVVEQELSGASNLRIDVNDPNSGIKSAPVNGRIAGMEIEPEQNKLIISLDGQTADAFLEVTLERQLIDAKMEGQDAPFKVFVDGQTSNVEEPHSGQNERTLRIPLPAGAASVEIVGTHVSLESLGYEDARLALTEARKVIADYRQDGMVVTDSENMLLEAQRAFDNGRYSFAEYLAERAAAGAHLTRDTASAASRALAEAETFIGFVSNLGLGVENAGDTLAQARQKYLSGEYDEASRMAIQAKDDASGMANRFYVILGIVVASVIAVAMKIRLKFPRRTEPVRNDNGLEEIFAEKRHLRESDKEVLRYIIASNGVTLSEIRKRFALPTSSSWRLAKRLEREELIEIEKIGNQNHVRFASGRSQ